MKRSSSWISGARAAVDGSTGRLQWSATAGHWSHRAPASDGGRSNTPIPVGTPLIVDWLRREIGWVRFAPAFDDTHMLFDGQSLRRPPDPADFVEALRLPIYVQGSLLASLLTSAIAL